MRNSLSTLFNNDPHSNGDISLVSEEYRSNNCVVEEKEEYDVRLSLKEPCSCCEVVESPDVPTISTLPCSSSSLSSTPSSRPSPHSLKELQKGFKYLADCRITTDAAMKLVDNTSSSGDVASSPPSLSMLFGLSNSGRMDVKREEDVVEKSLHGQESALVDTSEARLTTARTAVGAKSISATHPSSIQHELKSALRTSTNHRDAKKKSSDASSIMAVKHVRGLWGSSSDFAKLHDGLMTHIFSHLSMAEKLCISRVCQRWRHLARDDARSWTRIEATDYIQQVHQFYTVSHLQKPIPDVQSSISSIEEEEESQQDTVARATSDALARHLNRHSPQQLLIRSIGSCLLADHFHPSMKNLQELVLTNFDTLTDTHLHVMLLSVDPVTTTKKARSRPLILQKLVLDNCPRLTNASIRSIALQCPNLKEISMAGNKNINDLSALSNLYKIYKSSDLATSFPPRLLQQSSPTNNGIVRGKATLTAGVKSSKPSTSLLFTPPQKQPSTSNLTSLFAPPATAGRVSSISAKTRSPRASSASPRLSMRKTPPAGLPSVGQELGGSLERVCFADCPGIKPSVVLQSLRGSLGARVAITHLNVHGGGNFWTDHEMRRLSQATHVASIQILELSVSSNAAAANAVGDASGTVAGRITGTGLEVLLPADMSLGRHDRMGLKGHTLVPETAVRTRIH